MSIFCWWDGHDPDYSKIDPGGYTQCLSCDKGLSYDEIVTVPPKIYVYDFLHGWLVSPFQRCEDCNKRNLWWGHKDCEILPF